MKKLIHAIEWPMPSPVLGIVTVLNHHHHPFISASIYCHTDKLCIPTLYHGTWLWRIGMIDDKGLIQSYISSVLS